jgi:hypothetical protein
MSEPFALAQVTIDRAALISYLDVRPRSASQWDDWSRIGGGRHGFSWESDLPALFATVDPWLGDSYRPAVRRVPDAFEAPALGRCSYDEASRRFTFGTLTFSKNLNDLVFFFAAARGLARYLSNSQWASPSCTMVCIRPAEGRAVEKAQGADHDVDRGGFEPARDQVKLIVAHLFEAEFVG